MEKLTEIKYQRPDLDQFLANFQKQLDDFQNAAGFASAKTAAEAANKSITDVLSYAMLAENRHTIDTRDEYYDGENDFWDEKMPVVQQAQKSLAHAVLNSPFKTELVKESVIPAPYLAMAQNKITTFDEKLTDKFQLESSLESQYDKLIASAQIDFMGETLNLSQLAKHFSDRDQATRKKAQELHTNWFVDHENELDDIYDQLVKVRTEIATDLGFKDYSEMSLQTMDRFGYDLTTIKTYRDAIKKYVTPFTVRYYTRQAKRFDQDKLAYYDLDLEFPSGNAVPIGSSSDLVVKARKMYHEMSPETGTFFEMMIERDAMDLVAKAGKMSGGYAEFIPKWQVPLIFANFNGTSGDVDVLTHEAGHAFQTYLARDIKWDIMQFPTTEAAEIFSMSMEFFAYPWMDLFFAEQEKKYKYSHLGGTLTFLPYGALVDEFQEQVYQNPNLSPNERKQLWRKLEQAYLPYKDYEDNDGLNRGLYWMRQGHLFTSPFYYIDYTIAQVIAHQFYLRAIVDHDETAFSDYQAMAKAGGTKTLLELVKLGHLKSPFDADVLQEIVEKIEHQLDSIPENLLQ